MERNQKAYGAGASGVRPRRLDAALEYTKQPAWVSPFRTIALRFHRSAQQPGAPLPDFRRSRNDHCC